MHNLRTFCSQPDEDNMNQSVDVTHYFDQTIFVPGIERILMFAQGISPHHPASLFPTKIINDGDMRRKTRLHPKDLKNTGFSIEFFF
jgi:hypothetical protein